MVVSEEWMPRWSQFLVKTLRRFRMRFLDYWETVKTVQESKFIWDTQRGYLEPSQTSEMEIPFAKIASEIESAKIVLRIG